MVGAVVLAAGASSRYGGVKQRDLLPQVLAALAMATLDEVIVVEGAHPLCVDSTQARVVRCADWARGPGASLRSGLAALGDTVTRAVVVLADGPELDPRAVERVLAADAPVAAASYDGRTRGHPVALDRGVWRAVPDEGGRALEAMLVDCRDLQAPGDVDVRPAKS
jgi:CTP:molybdopterin cytidylyltransferase MocA